MSVELAKAISDVVVQLTSRLHDARQRFEGEVRRAAEVQDYTATCAVTLGAINGEIAALEHSIRLISDAMCDGIKMDTEDMLDTRWHRRGESRETAAANEPAKAATP